MMSLRPGRPFRKAKSFRVSASRIDQLMSPASTTVSSGLTSLRQLASSFST